MLLSADVPPLFILLGCVFNAGKGVITLHPGRSHHKAVVLLVLVKDLGETAVDQHAVIKSDIAAGGADNKGDFIKFRNPDIYDFESVVCGESADFLFNQFCCYHLNKNLNRFFQSGAGSGAVLQNKKKDSRPPFQLHFANIAIFMDISRIFRKLLLNLQVICSEMNILTKETGYEN